MVATPGAIEALARTNETPLFFLTRHAAGDRGDLSDDDRQENELSIREGLRILSAYQLQDGTKLWIITEADRSVTTILLPEEYWALTRLFLRTVGFLSPIIAPIPELPASSRRLHLSGCHRGHGEFGFYSFLMRSRIFTPSVSATIFRVWMVTLLSPRSISPRSEERRVGK